MNSQTQCIPPFVRREAECIVRRLPAQVDLEDLVSYGHLGLLQAMHRYDASRGASFDTYARLRVTGAIYDGLRSLGALRRRDYEFARRRRTTLETQPAPTALPTTLIRPLESRMAYRPDTDGDFAPRSITPHPERDLATRRTRARVRRAVAELPRAEREVIVAAYDLNQEGDTAAAYARREGIARSTVCRRQRNALDRLRRWLEAELREP